MTDARPAVEDTPAMMALRGEARAQLVAGVDEGKVAYDLARDGRGLSHEQLVKIIADLRAEGLIRR